MKPGTVRPFFAVVNNDVASVTLGLICLFIQFTWDFRNPLRLAIDVDLYDQSSSPLITTEATVLVFNLYVKVGFVWPTSIQKTDD